jgi:hypothetical protein
MSWGFRRSVKILPGVRLNFSKTGVGVSVGMPGARLSVSSSCRVTRTLGIPGTGVYHRTTLNRGTQPTPHPESQPHVPFSDSDSSPDVSLFDAALDCLRTGNLDAAKQYLQAATLIQGPTTGIVDVAIAPGLSAELSRDRDAAILLLSEVHQAEGNHAAALTVLRDATPTTHALIAACELLLQLSRFDDVVEATNGVAFEDDASGFGIVYRGIALRELGQLDDSVGTLDSILDSPDATTHLVGQALFERALSYQQKGQLEAARNDFAAVPMNHWLYQAAQAQLGGVPNHGQWSAADDDDDTGFAPPPLELPL